MKSTLRSVASRVYWTAPHFLRQVTGKVLILMYHRVIPPGELATTFVQPGMFVTTDTFERHLQFLTSRFELLSFQDLLARWRERAWDHRARYCTITFDDGWLDNYRYALPLLRAYGAPATIFLPTDFIGTGEWLWSDRLGYLLHRHGAPGRTEQWDSLIEQVKSVPEDVRETWLRIAVKALGVELPGARRFIDWDEAREMSHDGVAFGSHTCTHPILTRIGEAALQRELRRSLERLRNERVSRVPVLAYPNGEHTSAVVEAARAAGYHAAVTTSPGTESSCPQDLFRLKRIGVHNDVSQSVASLAFHIARQLRAA